MYDRSLGRDPETTADYVKRIVSLYGENGMGCVLKHFPGYGNNEDTHTGVALDERPYDVFRQQDFLPFQAGIQAEPDVCWCATTLSPAGMGSGLPPSRRNGTGFFGKSWALPAASSPTTW